MDTTPAVASATGAGQEMDTEIGLLLRVGVTAAAAVILTGGVLLLVQRGREPIHFSTFTPAAADLRNPLHALTLAMHGRADAIVQLGLLLLIATPVARVVLSVIAFLKQRDYLYVGVAGAVLAVLLYSLFLHK